MGGWLGLSGWVGVSVLVFPGSPFNIKISTVTFVPLGLCGWVVVLVGDWCCVEVCQGGWGWVLGGGGLSAILKYYKVKHRETGFVTLLRSEFLNQTHG